MLISIYKMCFYSFILFSIIACWTSGCACRGCQCLSMLLRRLLIRWELVAMGSFIVDPEGSTECLEQTRNGRGEDGTKRAEEFAANGQSDQRNHRLQSDSLPDEPWGQNIALEDMHEDKVGQHQYGRQPSLRQRKQDRYGTADDGSQHWDQFGD